MVREKIVRGNTYLGIELGSTRIKACLVDGDTFLPIAGGAYEWENKLQDGYWTYDLTQAIEGLSLCYASLKQDVFHKYGVGLTTVGAIGVSGMMHGYLALDGDNRLLVPFRTWRNTTTGQAAAELTALLGVNVYQRQSVAHLYQAILNKEPHITQVAHITTLAGYIYYLLTGKREIGVCEASGMFPIADGRYDAEKLQRFNERIRQHGLTYRMEDLLPSVKVAGDMGAPLSERGARLLDPSGDLCAGIPLCPPEGDAGTGMVATNSVRPKTGNLSAGTSVFLMLALEKKLSGIYEVIDDYTTPDGVPIAMVHSNNGCSELDLWVNMFGEFASLTGQALSKSDLYTLLYTHALSGDADCGSVISYNYLANEPVAGVENGTPLYFRTADSRLTLANFFRSQLYAAIAAMKFGMDVLVQQEHVSADNINAHGGLFKVGGVAQRFLSAALNTPVSVVQTAAEGGAWGMALLSAYMMQKADKTLADWLDERVFADMSKTTVVADLDEVEAFDTYFEKYRAGLSAFRQG